MAMDGGAYERAAWRQLDDMKQRAAADKLRGERESCASIAVAE